MAGMEVTEARDLAELQYHYGGAYVIALAGRVWLAERRDTHETLRAETSTELTELIRLDYAKSPVPR